MVTKNYKKLRIFVASPGDVNLERRKVHEIADELNRTGNLADSFGIALEVLDWQTHVSPFMGRPEEVVLQQLPVDSWDIFIGILWLRFGTASGAKDLAADKEYNSGTEEEFKLAYKSWQKKQRPQILFYRCERPVKPNKFDSAQYNLVEKFFKEFLPSGSHPGLPYSYEEVADFEKRVRQDLMRLLLDYGERVLKREPHLSKQGKAGKRALNSSDLKESYLDFVYTEHSRLKLFGFLSRANIDVQLLHVFVSLRFSNPVRELHLKQIPALIKDDQITTPAKVLQKAIDENKALLILGGPGYGKTTLMKYFAVCCRTIEGRELLLLKEPLIPIFIPLRQVDPQKPFIKMLAVWAKANKQPIPETLFKQWLKEPGALVLLDGLDEVSDLETRKQICRWIDKAIDDFEKSTFIVTCRFTGYNELREFGLKSDPLQYDVLALDSDQQETFFRQWFEAAALVSLEKHEIENEKIKRDVKNKAQDDAKKVVEFLSREENKSLQDLATVPVLLQIMAIIWREQGSLGGDRVELYSRSIDYLLEHREMSKKPPIEPLVSAAKARLVLRPLALKMQAEWQKDEAPQEKIENEIAAKLQEVKPGLKPQKFLENIRDRAGVLVGSGADTYTFQHKSFREFLAAIEIANQKKADLLVENFGGEWWRETILFSAGITSPEIFPAFIEKFLVHEKNAGATSPLLLQLVREAAAKPLQPFESVMLNQKLHWQKRYNALQCVRLLRSDAAIKLVKKAGQDKEVKVRKLAEEILIEWEILKPPETVVKVEPAIAKFKVPPQKIIQSKRSFHNPIELNAEYILIPGSKYKYSVTKKEVKIPPLYFAKYPVTNKLYRRFIDYLGGKSKDEALLRLPAKDFAQSLLEKVNKIEGFTKYLAGKDPAQWAYKLRSGYNTEKRFNGDDQPVVAVTWYAAVVYCHWLTEMQNANSPDASGQNEKLIYRLPIEEEWEWAASGGKRTYPWGNEEPTDKRANYDSKVGHTTPVGAYPAGATPEGLMDMAGNVWEWCANEWTKGSPARVLRGGAWLALPRYVACANRNDIQPDDRGSGIGFRCART